MQTIKCYTCDQCSLPLQIEHLEVADGCKYCKTIEQSRYFLGGIATRQCVKHCKPLSNWFYWSFKSVQFTVNCCTKDFCNVANFNLLNFSLLLICPLLWPIMLISNILCILCKINNLFYTCSKHETCSQPGLPHCQVSVFIRAICKCALAQVANTTLLQ
ncbi:hypothetical protein KSF78_0000215 [Schistosoma japonicum]|nr:hypothetical protein KSF78_0000215 [Schistosoma japonicum]